MTVPAAMGPAQRSRWIPWAFVAFFGVVLAVNVTMIVVGFATWPGLDTTDAYQRGLAYDRAIEAANAEAVLGWDADLAVSREGPGRALVEVALSDRDGNLIEDARVRARLVRPTHEGQDLELDLPHHQGGRYLAEVELPLAGQWEVRVVADHRGQRRHLVERVYLAP